MTTKGMHDRQTDGSANRSFIQMGGTKHGGKPTIAESGVERNEMSLRGEWRQEQGCLQVVKILILKKKNLSMGRNSELKLMLMSLWRRNSDMN